MEYVSHYECTICHQKYPKEEELMTCPACGEKGILEICYDYDSLKQVMTLERLKADPDPTIWRYQPMLSVRRGNFKDTLRVGGTPLYKSRGLGSLLNMKKLYIKDEGLNPTASLKDRASIVAVMKAIENKVDTIACSSTGNAASSLAGNAAKMGLKTVIFVPERAPKGKLAQLLIYGAKVILVKGDYKDTFELSKAAIAKYGWYNRNAAINPHLVEGKKTVAYEIAEGMDFNVPDWVCVSVGDGCTIAGVYKGFYDLFKIGLIDKIPRLLGVQSEGCAPFYKAFAEGRELEPAEENTLADSISVGIPRNPIKAMTAVRATDGVFIAVSDEAILEAMRTLGRYEGIFGEPAGVTALAGLTKAIKEEFVKPTDTVCVIVTGNGLKDIHHGLMAAGEPISCPPDMDHLNQILEGKGRE